jgi:hypothetical protein
MSSSSVIKIRQGLGLTNKVIAVFDGVSRDLMDTYAQAFSSVCEKVESKGLVVEARALETVGVITRARQRRRFGRLRLR